MTYNSHSGSTPRGGEYYYEDKYASPSPTPSPRGASYYYPAQTPQRPATRATHYRRNSSGIFEYAPSPISRTPHLSSPRYTSDGRYATATATANVSSSSRSAQNKHHSRRSSGAYYAEDQRHPPPAATRTTRSERTRRHSASYYRASDHYGESDEDELIEINGVTYVVLPARSSRTKQQQQRYHDEYHINSGGYETNDRYYPQTTPSARQQPFLDGDPLGYNMPLSGYDQIPEQPRPSVVPPRRSHSRRNSTHVPQRSQTARPTAAATSVKKPSSKHHKSRDATETDAIRAKIPAGYSLKNWDPEEEPVMLLGSVFDAWSLGRWIYDWTAYKYDGGHPITLEAADLWMLLIDLDAKLKRSEKCFRVIRDADKKDMIDEFIESGDRLRSKLRALLRTCEQPMLRSAKKAKGNQLGLNAGVEFVDTLWGRDRQLEKTEQFMASLRLWILRFDANCEEVVRNPYL